MSDLHCGSVYGMLPPGFVASDDALKTPNHGQAYLWDCWQYLAEQVADYPIVAVVGNGDCIDYLERRPSEYWYENCYATFQNDPLGLSQLDVIGADRCMWATDYPHSEGAFGFGRTSVRLVVDKTSPDDARAILGGNAIKVFKLDS